jgi:pilus assembly protein Flp/PilA
MHIVLNREIRMKRLSMMFYTLTVQMPIISLLSVQKTHNERRLVMNNWFNKMYINWMYTVKSEKGQTIVEYALLLVLIAIVVIAMIKGIGGSANTAFSKVNSALQ